jgi:hypothetical protein
MARAIRKSSICILFLTVVAVSLVGSLNVKALGPNARKAPLLKSSNQRSAPAGGLDVRIHAAEGKLKPAADLLLFDPQGRKTGKDSSARHTYKEIPSSSYERESLADDTSGAPGPETDVINVRNPAAGEYRLEVIGRFTGRYDLEIAGEDNAGEPSRVAFTNVKILRGAIHRYVINYPGSQGAKIAVRSK